MASKNNTDNIFSLYISTWFLPPTISKQMCQPLQTSPLKLIQLLLCAAGAYQEGITLIELTGRHTLKNTGISLTVQDCAHLLTTILLTKTLRIL